ncbi:alpha-1,2-fucosyltransferase [Paenibacillus sp. GYB004]|uniref:alpha-1,2-fucosyltransferase n=1 Tax=Paenibacillus sp. GYB004 TaxID=2994393 RepID=UPI002F969BFD
MLTPRPVVAMANLGTRGRFGNKLFQYAFLKLYAKRFRLRTETSDWIGRYLFGHNDPFISRAWPVVAEQEQTRLAQLLSAPKPRFVNVNFEGYFQFDTQHLAPYRPYFQSLFQPVPPIRKELQTGLERLKEKGRTIVGIHIRRGDYYRYRKKEKNRVFFIAPSNWYVRWLRSVWGRLDRPVLFLASDSLPEVIADFAEFDPVVSAGLYEKPFPEADYYPDFYLLSHCHLTAISNSTFSFAASMLNSDGRLFVRPDNDVKALVRYDPWASPPLLHYKRSYY